ncbi:AI-2E family transporter [Ancylobacter sp. 6x-1]|uniref:AI-2E family transporter n=1 Tax=Ancylobacter crimeensis TaxID=2579147 RepID=A0ABT0D677_9HYPH|nr:AI-2E family transporter [Ancylobacter crimeensis]MCK0195446.1 AI-2E family transporter [Ancylobacter crimeensis]
MTILHPQVRFWLAALAFVVLVCWLLSSVMLPFVAGLALAYFLNPVTTRLEHWGASRMVASLTVIAVSLLVIILLLLLVIPLFGSQLSAFLQGLPQTISKLQKLMTGEGAQWLRRVFGNNVPNINEGLSQLVSQGASYLLSFVQSIWTGGQALISLFSLVVITPVVAFYILNDWNRMVAKVDSWLPVHNRETIRDIARQMDRAIAGFLRGQALVCIILGTYYAIALTIAGLNFGLVIGIVSGLITFIPYVGSLTGFVLAVGIALVQFFPDWTMIGVIVAIFLLGQFVEGNILSPKLVGDSVGLHPVWLMFALLAFGYLLGFLGLLLAVPLAAAMGVLVRFALDQYLHSSLYTGEAIEAYAVEVIEPPGGGAAQVRTVEVIERPREPGNGRP